LDEKAFRAKFFIISFIAGLLAGGGAVGICTHLRELGAAREFDERTAILQREYDERQRSLEETNRELAERVENYGTTIEDARRIIESTAGELSKSETIIGEAGSVIKAIHSQIQNLEDLLNRRYPPGGGSRATGGYTP
jgi:peptidoglycan hydrolase CwlO-like protein